MKNDEDEFLSWLTFATILVVCLTIATAGYYMGVR